MTSTRPRSRRGEGERLRTEILDVTERLLIETGSEDAVSIRCVADQVGVTAPAIYRHFADKQALLFEVCSIHFTRLHEHLDAAMAAEADVTDRLRACGRGYVEFGLAHPEAYRIMFMGHSDWTPETDEREVLADETAFTGLVRVVSEVIEELDLDHDPFQASVVLWTAVHGVTSLLISKPNFPWPPVTQLVDDICAVHLRGMFGQE